MRVQNPRLPAFEQVGQVVPEELAAVDDFAGADVEEIDGQRAGFKVIAEDVGVVVLLGGGDALLFLELMDGGELVAQAGGGFKLLGFGGGGMRAVRVRSSSAERPSRKSCASRTAWA
jgi:hypothetical protein